MARVKVSPGVLEALGIRPDELRPPNLDADVQRRLEPLLASSGFNAITPIRVTELPDAKGFLLAQ